MDTVKSFPAKLGLGALALLATSAAYGRNIEPLPRPALTDFLIGEEQYVKTRAEDTLVDLAERHGIGYRELQLANPRLDPWLPGEGKTVVLPKKFLLPHGPREGIVLNTAEMRLYYYPADDNETVMTFPVSVGRQDWQTPLGPTRLVRKRRDPPWYPPASILEEARADGRELPARVPPGPDNPLGQFALDLAIPGYLIHGTNRPLGIGMPVTHGCIRLHPEDIRVLYDRVPENTPVTLIHQPFKVGWHDDVLYLEVHPPLRNEDSIDLSVMVQAVIRETESVSRYWVNWEHARSIANNPDGLPHPIGRAVRTAERVTLR
ncbi:MAG: L,D-transpeptidase family protein [Pseudomonadales bacterium]|nr:L,D-transpeptidase family protein [Pseudomonadales bacterium]